MKIEIKSRWSGEVLFAHECEQNDLIKTLRVGGSAKPLGLCWLVDDGQVLVTYADGDLRIYPAEAFVLREKVVPKGKAL